MDSTPVQVVPTVTPDQLELIKKTVAADATLDELKLFLHDCQRQRVHPLDHLLHFTKRGGRYTPVTSIDLMRMRAAETGEYAGNDEYEFTGTPARLGFKAVARVWRLVQGQRVPFTRPARWEEYCPPAGQDHMWRRMPHVMLGKCAEAQALRVGFPRQLHGLYAAEEIQGADGFESTTAEELPTEQVSSAATKAHGSSTISEKQIKRFFAIAKEHGWTTEMIRSHLLECYGIHHSKDIRVQDYDQIVADVERSSSATTPDPESPF